MIVLVIVLIVVMAWGLFGNHGGINQVTDFELYGDIDPYNYGKCQANKEYERGYLSARSEIDKGLNPTKLLNQVRSSLSNDKFDEGWRDACKEYIN